jgi:hypothetical protein
MRRSRTLVLVLLAALPLLHGCRTAPRGPQRAAETVLVEVDNNVALATAFTIYAFSETGSRRLLGSLSPGRPGTLRLSAADITGRWRFTAVRQMGAAITSPLISVNGGDTVLWNLRANTVVLAR